ncbi:MAG TPA: hypothetical protein VHB72_03020 [Candidatus Saccharimonadales bacterium]|nr:hypothetical protein [Candidatus Saccharimonadales bacterium]
MSETRDGTTEGVGIEPQAIAVHTHAAALFAASEHRFGTSILSGEETYDIRPADKVRHRAGRVLITFAPFELFDLDDDCAVASAPIDIVMAEPLPATPAWPNTYVQQTFTVGPRDLLLGSGAFDYRMNIDERASDGRIIAAADSVGLMAEDRPQEPLDSLEGELRQLLGGDSLEVATESRGERKLAVMQRLFPDIMKRFQPDCAAANFEAMVPLVLGLSQATEVGCRPSPYIRIP